VIDAGESHGLRARPPNDTLTLKHPDLEAEDRFEVTDQRREFEACLVGAPPMPIEASCVSVDLTTPTELGPPCVVPRWRSAPRLASRCPSEGTQYDLRVWSFPEALVLGLHNKQAVLVHDERGRERKIPWPAGTHVANTELLGDRQVGIGENCEAQMQLLSELFVLLRRVRRDRHDLATTGTDLWCDTLQTGEFLSAERSPVSAVENQNGRPIEWQAYRTVAVVSQSDPRDRIAGG
jgi:hypothetical protein